MLHYSNSPQPTIMKEQQQECSEIHTIQMFREAPSSLQSASSYQGPQQSLYITTMNTPIPLEQADVTDGIGGDWAIEMDEDIPEMEQPSIELDTSEHSQEGESSLYSFYFETPVVSMAQEDSSDDYTITSHNTESFHNNNDLDLKSMDDIWEQGLDHASYTNVEMWTPESSSIASSDDSTRDYSR